MSAPADETTMNPAPEEWTPSGHPIENLSDRELAMETVYWLRYTGQALAEIQKQGLGGIMKSMLSGGKK